MLRAKDIGSLERMAPDGGHGDGKRIWLGHLKKGIQLYWTLGPFKSDWGFTGPNCTTFTFNNLNRALDGVINGDYSDKLKCEAKEAQKKVKKIEAVAPYFVAGNIEDSKKEKMALIKILGNFWESNYQHFGDL